MTHEKPPHSEAGSREKLLEVAVRLFAEKGLDGVSTRDLAREAGLNISLISYYFGGKEGLYKAVLEGFGLEAKKNLGQILAKADLQQMTRESFLRIMREIVTGILEHKLRTPDMSKIMMREAMEGLPFAAVIYDQLFKELAEQVIGLLQSAQDRKIIRPDLNVCSLFLMMVQSVDGYLLVSECQTSLSAQCLHLPQDKEQVGEHLFKIFIEGVLL